LQSEHTSRRAAVLMRIVITVLATALFLLLRPDIVGLLQGKLQAEVRLLGSPHIVDRYIRNNMVRKLQIGAGENSKPGWLNTDIEPLSGQAYLDAGRPFPLPDRTFKYVYSEQVIEHVPYEQGLNMLKESYRVLETGGKVRIATPNLLQFIELFRKDKTRQMQDYVKQKLAWHQWPQTPDPECYILNYQLREWGHRFVYTPKMLRARLEEAGFRDIKEFHAGESDDPALKDLEERIKWATRDANAYEAMIFQGVRE